MDDLLIKYILEETTTEENNKVQQWLAADAANQAHFKKLQAVWQLAAHPNPQPVTDAQQALQRLKQILQARETAPAKRMWPRVWTTAAAIAGIAVLALGASIWLKPKSPVKEQPPVVHPDTVQQQPVPADTIPTVQPVLPLQTDTLPYVRPHKKKRVAPIPPVQPVRPKKRTQPTQPPDTTPVKKKQRVPSQPAKPARKHKTVPKPKEPQPEKEPPIS